MIVTFDKRLYPATLGACKHVLLTTYPQRDTNLNNYMKIPKKSRVAVLAEDADSNSKNITLLLDNHEIQLLKLDNQLKAKIDGKTIESPQLESYQYLRNGEIVFEIGKLPDQSIEVISDKYGISAVYDGERVQLLVSKNMKQTNIKSVIVT